MGRCRAWHWTADIPHRTPAWLRAAFLFLLVGFGTLVFGWVFFVQGTMYHAAREAARAMAVQEKTAEQGEAVAQAILDAALSAYSFSIDIQGTAKVQVSVSIPLEDLGISGLIPLRSSAMTATVIMERE